MKKILNREGDIVRQSLDGYLSAYSRYYEAIGDTNAFTFRNRRRNKVSLVIGGGSGHEPLFGGFVGKGLADASANGNIFASPNPQLIMDAAKMVDNGHGVLFVYGNYEGDMLWSSFFVTVVANKI